MSDRLACYLAYSGMRRGRARGFTLIELLVVVAIIAILASLLCAQVFASRRAAYRALTFNRLKHMSAAIELYRSDTGQYPKDPKNIFGADIPEFLFIALHNKPTPTLGGGWAVPKWDIDDSAMGRLNGVDDSFEPDSGPSFHNASLLGPVTHHSTDFQVQNLPAARAGRDLTEAEGAIVFVDAWGNAFHYREWSSKPSNLKTPLFQASDPRDRVENADGFQLWSNGEDGINQWNADGSDDLSRRRGA